MPRAGWVRFWRPDEGAVAPPGVVARAPARGESLEAILEATARRMLDVGRADRAAIWIENPSKPGEFAGMVVEARGMARPGEWIRVDVSLPFFRSLLESQEPVTTELGEGAGVSMIAPLAGMRSAAWFVLRINQKPVGLALVASARPRHSHDLAQLRRLADELAVAVAQRRESDKSGSLQEDLAAEERKRRTEAQLRTLLDSLDSGVLMFDVKGKVLLVNDRFAQLVGLDARGAPELDTFEALVDAIAGHFRDPLALATRWRELFLRGDQASSDELELIQPARRIIDRFARPVYGPEGERLGWLEIYRDITGQRTMHSKLLQTEKMAGLGQLVSGIAHELSNPLTSIMGFAQLLLGREASPESSGDARMIYQEAERASRIVKNLLLFARETTPERHLVNLNEIVERTLALRSYELKVENIAVECELDPDLPLILAGTTQMQQVVLNLVVNAEQAIQQGRGYGRIRARTQRLSPQRIALEVADDGPGIPPEIAPRIFDPFFTTKPAGMGTGLGLSIVYGIVHEHGGEITMESQPGGGASFVIELSAATALSAAAAETEMQPAQPAAAVVRAEESGPGSTGGSERILVVEDEPTVAQLIADVLREDGRRVETVLDSREGLEQLARQSYDLVICDLKMPHLNGRGFYRALVRAGNPL